MIFRIWAACFRYQILYASLLLLLLTSKLSLRRECIIFIYIKRQMPNKKKGRLSWKIEYCLSLFIRGKSRTTFATMINRYSVTLRSVNLISFVWQTMVQPVKGASTYYDIWFVIVQKHERSYAENVNKPIYITHYYLVNLVRNVSINQVYLMVQIDRIM